MTVTAFKLEEAGFTREQIEAFDEFRHDKSLGRTSVFKLEDSGFTRKQIEALGDYIDEFDSINGYVCRECGSVIVAAKSEIKK